MVHYPNPDTRHRSGRGIKIRYDSGRALVRSDTAPGTAASDRPAFPRRRALAEELPDLRGDALGRSDGTEVVDAVELDEAAIGERLVDGADAVPETGRPLGAGQQERRRVHVESVGEVVRLDGAGVVTGGRLDRHSDRRITAFRASRPRPCDTRGRTRDTCVRRWSRVAARHGNRITGVVLSGSRRWNTPADGPAGETTRFAGPGGREAVPRMRLCGSLARVGQSLVQFVDADGRHRRRSRGRFQSRPRRDGDDVVARGEVAVFGKASDRGQRGR